MAENPDDRSDTCSACSPDAPLVWEDEFWVLTADDSALVLTSRVHEGFGEIDDDLASQFGRISNRLVRILEGLPGAGRAELARVPEGAHAQVRVSTGSQPDLQVTATKLANWGGEARA